MSKLKEKEEEPDTLLSKMSEQPAEREELIQILLVNLETTTKLLKSLKPDQDYATDLHQKLTQIQTDSLRLTYSITLESSDGVIANFSNSTNVHQALGSNPTAAVSRINTMLTCELLEPTVLALQNFIAASTIATTTNVVSLDQNKGDNFLNL